MQLAAILEHVLGGQRLVGKAHVHHGAGVAFGGGQIDQAAFAGHIDAAAIGQRVLVQEVAHARDLGCHLGERLHVDLDIEVAAVGEDGAVAHVFDVVACR